MWINSLQSAKRWSTNWDVIELGFGKFDFVDDGSDYDSFSERIHGALAYCRGRCRIPPITPLLYIRYD